MAVGFSPNEKSRLAAAHVVAFICGAPARDMSLSCKGPAAWTPGAIPTVDFLLYRFGAIVKKMGVKSHDGSRHSVARMERSEIRDSGPGFRCAPSGLQSSATIFAPRYAPCQRHSSSSARPFTTASRPNLARSRSTACSAALLRSPCGSTRSAGSGSAGEPRAETPIPIRRKRVPCASRVRKPRRRVRAATPCRGVRPCGRRSPPPPCR